MERCEMLVTTEDGQVVAGIVTLTDDGRVAAMANAGYEILMRNILKEDNFRNGEPISLVSDPQGWFEALPYEYSGSMVRARMIWGDV